jgi:hypothetical protein
VLEDLERRQAEEAGARLICSARPSTRTRTRPCSAFGKIIILHFNRSSSIRSLCYSMLPKRKKIGHGRYQRLLPCRALTWLFTPLVSWSVASGPWLLHVDACPLLHYTAHVTPGFHDRFPAPVPFPSEK